MFLFLFLFFCHPVRTSSDHRLNVSISVAAHAPIRGIQPACAMLLPRLPTYTTASSSSASSAFDMHTSPSVDAESRTSRGRSGDREKCTEVTSSECVDVCFLSGAAACRGSLESLAPRSAQGYSDGTTKPFERRTSKGGVRLPVGAPCQRRLSGHLEIRRRKGGLFVLLRTALQGVTGLC